MAYSPTTVLPAPVGAATRTPALVLFGGSRIAGVGKGAGRAIREFKEETAGLNKGKDAKAEKDIEATEADVAKDETKPTE